MCSTNEKDAAKIGLPRIAPLNAGQANLWLVVIFKIGRPPLGARPSPVLQEERIRRNVVVLSGVV